MNIKTKNSSITSQPTVLHKHVLEKTESQKKKIGLVRPGRNDVRDLKLLMMVTEEDVFTANFFLCFRIDQNDSSKKTKQILCQSGQLNIETVKRLGISTFTFVQLHTTFNFNIFQDGKIQIPSSAAHMFVFYLAFEAKLTFNGNHQTHPPAT